MNKPLVFTADTLAPNASGRYRHIVDITPDDSEGGGFAKLMRAVMDDGSIVAIKRFHNHEGSPFFDADRQAAKREFGCLVELDGGCGHAPRAFALGTCTDKQGLAHHAIAMQYISGYTIDSALTSGVVSGSAGARPTLEDILPIAKHVCDGIAACSPRVVHRDISNSNIILELNAAGMVANAVLIDWGQSISTFNEHVTPSGNAGRKLATVAFGAPCVFGGKYYDERNKPSVDVYSFGVLLYYLCTGEIPFGDIVSKISFSAGSTGRKNVLGEREVELIAEYKSDPLSLSGKVALSTPLARTLDYVIGACTQFNPALRPTPDELQDLISTAVEKSPAVARTMAMAADAAQDFAPAAAAQTVIDVDPRVAPASKETTPLFADAGMDEPAGRLAGDGADAQDDTVAGAAEAGADMRAGNKADERASEEVDAGEPVREDAEANGIDQQSVADLIAALNAIVDAAQAEKRANASTSEAATREDAGSEDTTAQGGSREDEPADEGTSDESDEEFEAAAAAVEAAIAAESDATEAAADSGTATETESEAAAESDPSFESLLDFELDADPAPDAAEPDADADSAEGLYERALDCFYGHGGMKRDTERSMQLMRQAAEKGDVEAMFALGTHLVNGTGGKVDRHGGKRWLKRAASCGHPGANAVLQTL